MLNYAYIISFLKLKVPMLCALGIIEIVKVDPEAFSYQHSHYTASAVITNFKLRL